MGIIYKVCDCKDWQQGMTQINGFIRLGLVTKGYIYRGKQFVYCPWCGKQIKDADTSSDEGSIIIRTDSIGNDDTKYTATMK